MYFQAFFVFDRIRELAAKNPDLKGKQPYRAIIENDRAAIAGFTKMELATLLATTHSGMTCDEFDNIARNWLNTARHPRFQRLYKECVYQPQLELLTYLKANGFKTFIVSGGGIDFIRAYAEETYGIPPERVVGSSIKTRFALRDGKAELLKLPELNSLDDGVGKPININLQIGQRPILAFWQFGWRPGDVAIHGRRSRPAARTAAAPRRRPGGNTLTTAIPGWAGSIRRGTKRPNEAGTW